MSQSMVLGIATSVTVVFLIVLLTKNKIMKDFDERQNYLRGKAFQRAFFSVLIFCGIHVSAVLLVGRPLMEDGVGAVLAFCVGMLVFAVDCIIHDAFFSVKENPKFYLLLSGANAMMCGLKGLDAVRTGAVVRDGLLTMDISLFAIAAVFLVILIAGLMRLFVFRGEAE